MSVVGGGIGFAELDGVVDWGICGNVAVGWGME